MEYAVIFLPLVGSILGFLGKSLILKPARSMWRKRFIRFSSLEDSFLYFARNKSFFMYTSISYGGKKNPREIYITRGSSDFIVASKATSLNHRCQALAGW